MRTEKSGYRVEELKSEAGIWRIVKGGGEDKDQVKKEVGQEGEESDEEEEEEPKKKTVGWLVTYVDDILGISKGSAAREVLEHIGGVWKCSEVEYLEEGKTINFVGLQIHRMRNRRGLIVHQADYSKSVLKKNGMLEANPSRVTGECAEDSKKVEAKKEEEMSEEEKGKIRIAQRLVGEIIWLSTKTRPDLSFTTHRAATMSTRDAERSAAIIKKLLRYLVGTVGLGLKYGSAREVQREEEQERPISRSTTSRWWPTRTRVLHRMESTAKNARCWSCGEELCGGRQVDKG